MNKTVKCRFCGAEIEKEIAYQDTTRKSFYFCSNEHFIEYEQKHDKKIVKSKNPTKTQATSDDYKELIDYIYALYDKKIPSFVFKQINDMVKRGIKPLTYKGIELSLRYWVDTLEKGFDRDNGVGIVDYVYSDAEQFWKDKQRIKKASKNMKNDNVVANRGSANMDAMKYKIRKGGKIDL